MLAVRKLAWAAAIVESQGKIRCQANFQRRTSQLILQVQSSRIPVVERLGHLTDSKIQYTDAKVIESDRHPCLEHCTEAHVHVITEIPPMALWAITGAGAAVVLDNLIPHIVSNAGLQLLVDNLIDELPDPGGRGWPAIEKVLVRLRKIGWRIPDALWPREPAVEPVEQVAA
jgi:hypothetical protein